MATARATKEKKKVELTEKQIDTLKKKWQLSEEEIRQTFGEFQQVAATGQLNETEFINFWRATEPGDKSADAEDIAKRIFAFFDRDHSGKVDFNEFLLATILLTPGKPKQKLSLMFIACDFNHDGFLQLEEIEKLYIISKASEKDVNEKEFAEFKTYLSTTFPKYDVNKDGKMSQKEFANLCTQDEVFKKLVQ